MRRIVFVVLIFLMLPIAASADDASELVKGNNAFAVALYKQLKSNDGNFFFSPESISTALAITYAGARGVTADEMARVLHFTLPPDRLNAAMWQLTEDLNSGGSVHGYSLRLANALWLQKGFELNPDFLALTNKVYGAGANVVDFKGATEDARLAINKWVEERTENKIKDLFTPGTISDKERLVLTNAVYFKGSWAKQFDKGNTRIKDFNVSKDAVKVAPFMFMDSYFNYLDKDSFRAIQIPYAGNDLSMAIFLPKDIDGLAAFENSMTPENLQDWLTGVHPNEKLELYLPKFEANSEFGSLEETLKNMGVRAAFSSDADFSGIVDSQKTHEPLKISKIVHKAYVNVDEEGTEAAAATGVGKVTLGVHEPSPAFRVDHPFIYLIFERHSGTILFMGRITDPSKLE